MHAISENESVKLVNIEDNLTFSDIFLAGASDRPQCAHHVTNVVKTTRQLLNLLLVDPQQLKDARCPVQMLGVPHLFGSARTRPKQLCWLLFGNRHGRTGVGSIISSLSERRSLLSRATTFTV